MIHELVSMIRGCDQSTCEVFDPDCLTSDCSDNCGSCTDFEGPSQDTCYCDPSLTCCGTYWSSSQYDIIGAWAVRFDDSVVSPFTATGTKKIRCTRSWCDGWYDPTSHLCWEEPPPNTTGSWTEARQHCSDMGGAWRMPTLDELRSLVRGCASSYWNILEDSGGACGLHNDCSELACWSGDCMGCASNSGPDDDPAGCYWPPALSGTCGIYWTSTPYADDTSESWGITFDTSALWHFANTSGRRVRCVMSVK